MRKVKSKEATADDVIRIVCRLNLASAYDKKRLKDSIHVSDGILAIKPVETRGQDSILFKKVNSYIAEPSRSLKKSIELIAESWGLKVISHKY